MAYSHLPLVGSVPQSTGILDTPWVKCSFHLSGSATKALQFVWSSALKRGAYGVTAWVFFRFSIGTAQEVERLPEPSLRNNASINYNSTQICLRAVHAPVRIGPTVPQSMPQVAVRDHLGFAGG